MRKFNEYISHLLKDLDEPIKIKPQVAIANLILSFQMIHRLKPETCVALENF